MTPENHADPVDCEWTWLFFFSLAVTPGLVVMPTEPSAAPGHQRKTEGQILMEGSELLVKPPLADGRWKQNSDSVEKQLAIRAQL